jgi:hypothetical protein
MRFIKPVATFRYPQPAGAVDGQFLEGVVLVDGHGVAAGVADIVCHRAGHGLGHALAGSVVEVGHLGPVGLVHPVHLAVHRPAYGGDALGGVLGQVADVQTADRGYRPLAGWGLPFHGHPQAWRLAAWRAQVALR